MRKQSRSSSECRVGPATHARRTSIVALAALVAVLGALSVPSLTGCAGGEKGDAEQSAGLDSTGNAVVPGGAGELTEYEDVPLNTFYRTYDNSIEGPQEVDLDDYRLEVIGLVERPASLTYEEVLDRERQTRLTTLFCVEGWQERLLFEGVRVRDVLEEARPTVGVRTIIFHAADGYTSSLPYEDVERLDLMLAAKVNGLPLDAMRGMPFQVVAETKFGYKWVKWVTKIELSSEPFSGFWESRGYSNEADVQTSRIERERGLVADRLPSTPNPD
ncbi:MAG: molybdopterin-dependent oxidoreductase [Candidatus Eisenbacteria bacterium]